MKATGIVRKVDELGRIVLPKELRRTLGIIRYIHSTPVCNICANNMQMLYRTAEGGDDE